MLRLRLVIVALVALVCAIGHFASPLKTLADRNHHGSNTTISTKGPVTDCGQIKVTIDDEVAARDESRLTIPRAKAAVLEISAPESGGVQVQGWNRDEFSVVACRAASRNSADGGRALLDRISISFENGHLTVRGPGDRDLWIAYLLIQAPFDAAMNLEATNGPIDLYETAGKLQVRTENGPIGLKRCSGDLDVHAENGPISISGSRGNVRIRTQNGPISVNLTGNSWENGELRADAINGPLNVNIPRDYKSGVLIKTSNHSPVSCRDNACSQATRTWDDDSRRIEFGKSFVVRMSTVNGPINVESRSAEN